jgi:hypothetical protein
VNRPITSKDNKLVFKKFLGRARWHTSVLPATWEIELGTTEVQGQPRQKVSNTSSQTTIQEWWYTSVSSATWEVQVEGL